MQIEPMAKVKLGDGRFVWRMVYVRYRDVQTGQWLSNQEVETLLEVKSGPGMDSHAVLADDIPLAVLEDREGDVAEWFVLGRKPAQWLLGFLKELPRQSELGEALKNHSNHDE